MWFSFWIAKNFVKNSDFNGISKDKSVWRLNMAKC